MKKLKDILLLAKRTVLDPAGTAAELSAPGAPIGGLPSTRMPSASMRVRTTSMQCG